MSGFFRVSENSIRKHTPNAGTAQAHGIPASMPVTIFVGVALGPRNIIYK